MALVLPSTVQLTKGVRLYTNPLLTPETDESEKCLLPEKMTLQAAMALSGLSPDSFDGTLNRFYQQGAILLKSPNGGGGVGGRAESSSSTTTDRVIISQENGISSLSGRLTARRNLEPYFEMLTGTDFGLQDTNENVRILTDLPSPPISSPSTQSSSKSSSPPTFSGNLPTDKHGSGNEDDDNDDDDDDDDNYKYDKKENSTIIYQGRDILDLYSNISKPFGLVVSDIGTGTKSFFENRSLFSRTAGVELPAHQTNECKCGYVEYSYF